MPEILLGLDIGSRNMKAALIKRGKKNQIIDAATLRTPDGSIAEGELVFLDGAAEALKKFIAKSGAKPTALAACVNSPNIITRNLTLPALPAEEASSAVRFEIFKLFPTIKETHVIAQKTLAANASSMYVLAALCPIELLKTYKDLAARLGLTLKYADIRENAQAKAAALFGADGGGSADGRDGVKGTGGDSGLLIDIGYQSSHVSVIKDGGVMLSRYVMSGASAYDGMTAGKSGVSRDDIEAARISGDYKGIEVVGEDAEYIRHVCFSEIDSQIRQTAGMYENDEFGGKITFITVVGEGGTIPGVEDHFAKLYNIQKRSFVFDDKKAAGAGFLKKGGNPLPLLSAVGCAFGESAGAEPELNFTPPAVSAAGRAKAAEKRRAIAAAAAVAALAAAACVVAMYYYIADHSNHAEIGRINEEIWLDYQITEQSAAIAAAEAKLSGVSSLIDAIGANSVRASGIIDELTAQAPESLFVISLSVPDSESAVMNGRAKNYGSITEYALLLRRTGRFESVRINSITMNQTVSEALTDYSFTMTVTMKKD